MTLANYFHGYPHLDGSLRQANDTFDPYSHAYMKSIGMIIMLHFVLSLIVLLAVLGIFLLIQLAFPKKIYNKDLKKCLWWTIVVCACLMFLGIIFEIVYHVIALKLISHSGSSNERIALPSDTAYDSNYKQTVENVVFHLMINTLPEHSEAETEMTDIKNGIVHLMRNVPGSKEERSSDYDIQPKMNIFKIVALNAKKWSQFAVMIVIWCIILAIIVCLLFLLDHALFWLCVLGALVLVLLLAATLTAEAMFVADACQNTTKPSSRLAKRTALANPALDPECEQYVNQMGRYYKHYFNKYDRLYNKHKGLRKPLHDESKNELEGYRNWGERQMKLCASMEERRADSDSALRDACDGNTLLMWVTAQLVAVLVAAGLLVGILLIAIYAKSFAFSAKDANKCQCGVPNCGIGDCCNSLFQESNKEYIYEGKMNTQKTVHGVESNANYQKQRTTYIASPPETETSTESSVQYYNSPSRNRSPSPNQGSRRKSRSRRRVCLKKKRNKCPEKCFSSGCILRGQNPSPLLDRGSQTDIPSRQVRQNSKSYKKQNRRRKQSSEYYSDVDLSRAPPNNYKTVVKNNQTQYDTSPNSSRKKKKRKKTQETVSDNYQRPSRVRNTGQSPPREVRNSSSRNYENSVSRKTSKTNTYYSDQTPRKPGFCSRLFRRKREDRSGIDANYSASTNRSRPSTVRFDQQLYPSRVPCGALQCSDLKKCSCCMTLSQQMGSRKRSKHRRETETYIVPTPASSGRRRSKISATSGYTPAYSASTVYLASPFTTTPAMTPSSAFMPSLKLTPSPQLSIRLGRNPWSPRTLTEDNTSRNRSSGYVTSSRSHYKGKRSRFRLKRTITPKFRRKTTAGLKFLIQSQDNAIHLSPESITPERLTPVEVTPEFPPVSRENISGGTAKKRVRTIYLKLTPSMLSKRQDVGQKSAPDHYIEACRALDGYDSEESKLITFPILDISALRDSLTLRLSRQCDR